ncbi:iron ABC transporter permease [Rhizobium sp. AG855]|uniref:FecCD family ABC transporter permease n=1 Tax=Rhizobium sp. AG855 TaxID=2183898 RepID=UPI000E70C97D|nr:iron ABC transporter permease [Rhizobium sp. AG855]RKE86239.1 iron complex transport system permease protein [Rhizobium sp. AG855]
MSSSPHLAQARRQAYLLPGLLAFMLVCLVLAVFLGVVDLDPSDTLAALTGQGSAEAHAIILDIRLPRILTGMLAGVHFALAGLLLQSITRNPLADPSLMGVSQGAMLAVSGFLVISVYSHDTGSTTLQELPVHWLPLIGTLGGLAAGAFIYLIAFRRDLGPLRITLCGIAVGAVLHAIGIGLMAGWGSGRLEVLLEWFSGSLYARGWQHALFLLPFTIAGLAVLPVVRRPLDLLRFDATVARSFGLSYRTQFSVVLLIACTLAASAVGVVGPVVFVGLIVPHMARFLAGQHTRIVLPLTIMLGAITMTLADLAGRLAGGAEEIPIGVVTAICGVPLLVALLRRTP